MITILEAVIYEQTKMLHADLKNTRMMLKVIHLKLIGDGSINLRSVFFTD